jgi:hypothetical protein
MAIEEIAPDLYRISTYAPGIDLQFNQFLVKDDEPLLYHTGMKSLFPTVLEAVSTLIDPSRLRWIGFSHFEADECGSLNEWLQLAPAAQPVCSVVGALVSINDFAVRPALGMTDGEVLNTGKYRFRFIQTPHVPHCWEAALLGPLSPERGLGAVDRSGRHRARAQDPGGVSGRPDGQLHALHETDRRHPAEACRPQAADDRAHARLCLRRRRRARDTRSGGSHAGGLRLSKISNRYNPAGVCQKPPTQAPDLSY